MILRNRIFQTRPKTGELRSFIYQNSYIITKEDLIEFLAIHATDEGKKHYKIQARKTND